MSRDPLRAASQFFGGRVCLDFANTVDWRTSEEPQELVPDYASFLEWCVRRGTVSPQVAAGLGSRARANPARVKEVMSDARALRAEIWEIADALREHHRPDIGIINSMVVRLPAQPALLQRGDAYLHDLPRDDLRAPLWPILWSLTAVLTSADARRIGCCHAEGCGWFFVDESPNRTRLWCSSEVCGNRERARRAYAKRSQRSSRAAR
jgi:predicted RNA-binding Zn ribbon-like protein